MAIGGSRRCCEGGMAGGQGPGAADLATGRAESAAETEAARAVVAERWLLRAAAAGAGEPCLELRLRQCPDARRQDVATADADRRIHAGVPGDPGGAKDWAARK